MEVLEAVYLITCGASVPIAGLAGDDYRPSVMLLGQLHGQGWAAGCTHGSQTYP